MSQCGNDKAWLAGGVLYECRECGRQASVIAGTIFQDSRKPLKTWFAAIWRVTTQKHGGGAEGLQQVLGLKSYQSAWTWLHKTRRAMARSGREPLSGTIEVDETYIGGAESGGKRGRGTENKALVVIAVELDGKRLGRVRMRAIEEASGETLKAFIGENTSKGSKIITDGWPGHSKVDAEGYDHEMYTRSGTKQTEETLLHVHLVVSLVKRWLLGARQEAAQAKHLQGYLEEYTFRFNRKNAAKRGFLFYRLLEIAMQVEPLAYRKLAQS
jgi:transposase-like protein